MEAEGGGDTLLKEQKINAFSCTEPAVALFSGKLPGSTSWAWEDVMTAPDCDEEGLPGLSFQTPQASQVSVPPASEASCPATQREAHRGGSPVPTAGLQPHSIFLSSCCHYQAILIDSIKAGRCLANKLPLFASVSCWFHVKD